MSDAVQPLSLRKEEDSVFLSAVSTSRFLDLSCAGTYPYSYTNPRGGGRNASMSKPRPRTLVKLTSSARNRPVLAACGIDVVMPLQEFKMGLMAFGAMFPGFLGLFLNLSRSRPKGYATARGRHQVRE